MTSDCKLIVDLINLIDDVDNGLLDSQSTIDFTDKLYTKLERIFHTYVSYYSFLHSKLKSQQIDSEVKKRFRFSAFDHYYHHDSSFIATESRKSNL